MTKIGEEEAAELVYKYFGSNEGRVSLEAVSEYTQTILGFVVRDGQEQRLRGIILGFSYGVGLAMLACVAAVVIFGVGP